MEPEKQPSDVAAPWELDDQAADRPDRGGEVLLPSIDQAAMVASDFVRNGSPPDVAAPWEADEQAATAAAVGPPGLRYYRTKFAH